MFDADKIIKYFPYLFLVFFAIIDYPACIMTYRFRRDDIQVSYARNFYTVCDLLTLPIISGLFAASSILSFMKTATNITPNWGIIVTCIVLYFIMLIIILSFVLVVELGPKYKIKMPYNLFGIEEISFDICGRILKLFGIIFPPVVDILVRYS